MLLSWDHIVNFRMLSAVPKICVVDTFHTDLSWVPCWQTRKISKDWNYGFQDRNVLHMSLSLTRLAMTGNEQQRVTWETCLQTTMKSDARSEVIRSKLQKTDSRCPLFVILYMDASRQICEISCLEGFRRDRLENSYYCLLHMDDFAYICFVHTRKVWKRKLGSSN